MLDYSEDTDWKQRNPYGWPPNQCRYQWPENKHVQSIYQKSRQFVYNCNSNLAPDNTNIYEFLLNVGLGTMVHADITLPIMNPFF